MTPPRTLTVANAFWGCLGSIAFALAVLVIALSIIARC